MAPACEQIRSEFSALLDDELNSEDRELVEEHLAECAECLRELHGFKQVADAYRYHHPVKAPDDFEERLRDAMAPAPARFGQQWPAARLAAAAAIVVGIGLAYWRMSGPEPGAFQTTMRAEEPARESTADAIEPAAEADTELTQESMAQGAPPEMGESEALAGRESDTAKAKPVPGDQIAGESAAEEMAESVAKRPPEFQGGGAGFGGGGGGFGGRRSETRQRDGEMTGRGADGFGGAATNESEAAPPATVPAPPAPEPPSASEPAPQAKPPAPAPASEPAPHQLRESAAMKDDTSTTGDADTPATPSRRAELKREQPGAPADGKELEKTMPEAVSEEAVVTWREQRFSVVEGTLEQAGYDGEPLTEITLLSDAWHDILDRYPDLVDLVDGTQPVIVQLDKTWYRFKPTA